MSSMRAIVVDPDLRQRLGVAEVDRPEPGPHQALVQVEATSLNRGDLLAVQVAEAGWRPGHDLAGTVIAAAADGTGPTAGSRVVGLLDSGAWAEQVAIATDRLAELPDAVSFAQASTLPTAGLTAHRAVEKGGSLLGKRVLITGSTGGVGLFAHQLATSSGAFVVGTSRQPRHETVVRDLGADEVVVGDDLSSARAFGPYDLVVESLGGAALAHAMGMLVPGGTCVSFGWSVSAHVELDLQEFLAVGGGTLYGLRMYNELLIRPASEDLRLLAELVADRRLRIPIEAEGSWEDIGDIAHGLMNRTFTGKAVLHLHR
ncbi:NADPH:quinone reductase-like Zn-dependent oxidoreductase [Allobranchiibius huperziae]|uniref:NADPH:quinone reductase-like Zn-dependent oxidoreductase n=2 Tax=Allobranchiibius huperziae TaxID=1874116 RepID=A0A853DF60_9MICO|nr:NADPH:quinone reductase-like Zn-dependent oxidoreductase [Allobranchiibius huperziae]